LSELKLLKQEGTVSLYEARTDLQTVFYILVFEKGGKRCWCCYRRKGWAILQFNRRTRRVGF